MGLRINTAIGWGMPAATFWGITPHAALAGTPGDDRGEALADLFGALTREGCVVPADYRAPGAHGAPRRRLAERRLLARDSRFASAEEREAGEGPLVVTAWGEGSSLLVQASNADGLDAHVVLMPNAHYGSRWSRSDDDIDYAMMRIGTADEAGTGTGWLGAVYAARGHHPYDDRVDAEGRLLSAVEALALPEDSTRPAVPLEIRWLATTMGILDEEGVDRLRPVVARWWS